MKALVIGASGLVGTALLEVCRRNGDQVTGTFYSHEHPGMVLLDLRDKSAVYRLLHEIRPDVIYLPAAATNVDSCELHERESFEVNVTGPGNVVEGARDLPGKIVYFSTDYVFDGTKGPYTEKDLPNPLSIYGRHKLAAEELITRLAASYLIVRTTWVYGVEQPPRNFVARTVQQLGSGVAMRTPVDQWGNPTYAPNLAELVHEAVRKDLTGILNIAGPEVVNRYQLALAAAEVFHLPANLVSPVNTDELGQAARRPLRGGLVVERARSLLSAALLGVHAGLQTMGQALENKEQRTNEQ